MVAKQYFGQLCVVTGCDRSAAEKGRCHSHAVYFRRNGRDGTPIIKDPVVRLMRSVDKNGPLPELRPELGQCWLWTGATRSQGRYGTIFVDRRNLPTHRYSYEVHVGPIPDDLVLDHLCRRTLCCNPAHLEPVAQVENILRGESWQARNARKTHCWRGHPFAGDNLRVNGNRRTCLTCEKMAYDRRQDKIRRGEIPRHGGKIGPPKGTKAR